MLQKASYEIGFVLNSNRLPWFRVLCAGNRYTVLIEPSLGWFEISLVPFKNELLRFFQILCF